MTQRRCCCGGTTPDFYPCQPCPSPIPPATRTEWGVTVSATGIICDAAGTGVVAGGQALDCKRGGCGRIKYRRKALGLETLALGVCDEQDMCDAMLDDAAPEYGGTATVRWSFCGPVLPFENPLDPRYPDIMNVQSPYVQIAAIYPEQEWNPATCFWIGAGPSTTDCRTVIQVEFNYNDTFSYPYFYDSGFCDEQSASFSTGLRQWRCYYSRRVAPGQFYAEGTYYLVRCEQATAVNTLGPTAGPSSCSAPAPILCSPDGLTPVTPSTTWKPPSSIVLVRYS